MGWCCDHPGALRVTGGGPHFLRPWTPRGRCDGKNIFCARGGPRTVRKKVGQKNVTEYVRLQNLEKRSVFFSPQGPRTTPPKTQIRLQFLNSTLKIQIFQRCVFVAQFEPNLSRNWGAVSTQGRLLVAPGPSFLRCFLRPKRSFRLKTGLLFFQKGAWSRLVAFWG